MTTPILSLSEIAEGVASQAALHNTALRQLEARSVRVLSRTTDTPAVGATEGDSYILRVTATGAWAGKTNQIAAWLGGAWTYYEPIEGVRLWVNDEDAAISFDGAAWVVIGGAAVTAPFADTTALVKGSADATKRVRFEVDGLTTATTRAVTVPDKSGTMAMLDDIASGGALTADTDGTLAANSDSRVATQKATKTYVDQIIAAQDAMVFKGATDCSANPNYPAADRGHTYRVSVAGKIGGASGVNVEAGDLFMCLDDSTPSGTQAAQGSHWSIAQTNLDGAVIGPASAADNDEVLFDGTSGKLVKSGGARPYDVGGGYYGTPTASVVVMRYPFPRAATFAAGLSPSQGVAATAATAQTDFDLKKNGSSFGTMRFAAAGTTASFIAASPTSFAAGDILTVVAPATPDATLAHIGFAIAGTRS